MEMNVYLPLIGVSMVASGISIFTAFDRSDIRRSAVQYCTYSVFCCDFLWALFRFVLYLLGTINGKLPSPNSGNRRVTDLNETIVIGEAIFTVAGDLFIVASSIWIALSAYEMQRVVTHTLTRPEEQERRTILTYEITIYVPLAIMLLLFSLGPVSKKDIGTATTCLMVSLYLVVWSLFLAVLYLPFSFCKIYSVRQNRAGFFDHSLEHIYRRLRILLIVYACTTIPTSVVSLAAEMNPDPHVLGPLTNSIFFATNCLFYLTGLFNAFSIGGSVLCCLRCLRPVMPRDLHEELMAGGRSSDAMMTSQNSTSPPDHLPVFVCTDIEGSTLLWSRLPGAMTIAQSLHDDCMRLHLSTYNGYEITTAGDAFQLAFHTVTEAISYCMTIQLKLMDEPWPKELDDFMCAKNVTDMFGRPLFRGLRVRMAIHLGDGDIIRQIHPTTGKWTYVGLPELVAREIGDSGLGGQILISNATRDRYVEEMHEWPKPAKKDKRILNHERDFFFRDAPSCSIGDLNIVVPMSEVVPYLLRSRFSNNRAEPIHLFVYGYMLREMPGMNLHLSMRRSSASHPSTCSNVSSDKMMAHLDNPDAFRQFDLNHAACLTKRGKTIHHVVLRVFIIADGYVFYFKNAAATQPSGLLPIDGSEYKLHKYQVSPHLYNSCFELRTPLRSWGSVVLHYHGCSESDVQDIVHQLETAGSKRVRDTFTEPSAACPATTEEEEEKLESPTCATKEACPSTPSSDRITTQSTFTSIMSSDVALAESPLCQIHHIDKRGLKVPLLDLTWTELHDEYPDMCKALGLPLDDSHGFDKILDISTDLCHDLCTNGTIVRPWGTLSMETATSHGFRSSLSSSMSFASENDVGSSTVHLETSSIATATAAVSPLTSPSPEETSPQEDSTSRRRISRRSSVHRKVGTSRETSLVISSGILLPPKSIPDVKLIQAISLAESYSGGFSLRQYTPLKIIGKGGFGQVMVARHNLTHQIFAIKTMNKHTLTTQNQVAHTKAERNVLIKCYNHPFIVKLHAAFQTIDHLHMVLEFCPGGELFFHLSKAGRFSESQTAFYAAEIFLALDHLHAHAIIYRDLKPENVLLDRDGHIRLADFGLSKENVSERKLAATFCGSAEYISPEVLELADATCDDSAPVLGGYDKGVDLWALGCLIFELLTGLPPFYSGKCRTELYAKIKEGYVDFPPYLSADAKDVVSRLLNPNPRERLGYKDPNELKSHAYFMDNVTDWDKLMAREVVPPMQPPTGEYMNFDDAFTSIPLDKQVLEDMAEFTKRNTMEHQLFDNYNWAPPEGGTVPNAS